MMQLNALLQPLQLSAAAEQAYLALLQQLFSALQDLPHPVVIGISGAQGSGKVRWLLCWRRCLVQPAAMPLPYRWTITT